MQDLLGEKQMERISRIRAQVAWLAVVMCLHFLPIHVEAAGGKPGGAQTPGGATSNQASQSGNQSSGSSGAMESQMLAYGALDVVSNQLANRLFSRYSIPGVK